MNTISCDYLKCQQYFIPKRPNQRFCSSKCRSNEASRIALEKLKSERKNTCLFCGKRTHNPSFCSMSCSASFNNRAFPKKRRIRPPRTKLCRRCKTNPANGKRLCDSCTKSHRDRILNTAVGDLKVMHKNKSLFVFHAIIRGYGKTIYEASGKPKKCYICGYDKFYDVCHVKSISSFPDSATMREIHNIDNLVALCPNHHREFDRGMISL